MTLIAPVITVDGPSGSGKGTLCRALASTFNWNLLDSGAIYRILALAVLHHQLDFNNQASLILIAANLDVSFIAQPDETKIILEGENISDDIRTEKIGNIASKLSVCPKIRAALLQRQQEFRKPPGLIADGRDMGTIVFPDAIIKFFLTASPKMRAKRRVLELQQKGFNVNMESILAEMEQRDARDYNRKVAPLFPAKDAIVIDSDNISIEDILKTAITYVKKSLTLPI